jgi:hypothetical protein
VCAWLKGLGQAFVPYCQSVIVDNAVSGLTLFELDDKVLTDSGMTNALHRKRLIAELQRLKAGGSGSGAATAVTAAAASAAPPTALPSQPAGGSVVVSNAAAEAKSMSATIVSVPKSDRLFDEVKEKFHAAINGHIDDYVAHRIKAGLMPLSFRLIAVDRIDNDVLSGRFERQIAR